MDNIIAKIIKNVLGLNYILDEIMDKDLRDYGMSSKKLLIILSKIETELEVCFDLAEVDYTKLISIKDFVDLYNDDNICRKDENKYGSGF